jgi:hypothetical protein
MQGTPYRDDLIKLLKAENKELKERLKVKTIILILWYVIFPIALGLGYLLFS